MRSQGAGPGADVLRVVSDGQVCPAAHFEHSEALVHLDRAHADLFIEARCRGGVTATQSHVAGPDRRTGIRCLAHGRDRTRA
jgi:hypothetical protein